MTMQWTPQTPHSMKDCCSFSPFPWTDIHAPLIDFEMGSACCLRFSVIQEMSPMISHAHLLESVDVSGHRLDELCAEIV
jgi:hypothetical protein